MSSAATAHSPSHTVAGIEHCLALDGIPLDRLLNDAKVPRSTWSTWRAGRARPRPDRWAVVIAAFDALVARSEPAPAEPESEAAAAAAPVTLTGSSARTGTPPTFTPVATAPAPSEAPIADSDTAVMGSGPFDKVEVAAERVIALAEREWAALTRDVDADDRAAMAPNPRRLIASRAATRLCRRMNRRLRWATVALADLPARMPAEVAAKARAVLAIPNTTDSDPWWVKLRDATIREAARLDRMGGVAGGASPQACRGLASLTASEGLAFAAVAQDWVRSEVQLAAAIAAGSAPGGTLDKLVSFVDAHRRRFLDTPARTFDGVLAKSLVLADFIQDGYEPLARCFEALQGATVNTSEARFAFPVMRDLGAMLTERGITVEALAALPIGDADSERDEVARLTAEWLEAGAYDLRTGEDMNDLSPRHPEWRAVMDRSLEAAEVQRGVLRRIADLRSLAPRALALKAAVVLVDAKDANGLDEIIAKPREGDLCDFEIAVALSIVRDLAADLGGEVRRLVSTVEAAAAALPRSPAPVAPACAA